MEGYTWLEWKSMTNNVNGGLYTGSVKIHCRAQFTLWNVLDIEDYVINEMFPKDSL